MSDRITRQEFVDFISEMESFRTNTEKALFKLEKKIDQINDLKQRKTYFLVSIQEPDLIH